MVDPNSRTIVFISRNYPTTGGRNSLLRLLLDELSDNFNFKIIHWGSENNGYYLKKRFLDNTASEYAFYYDSYRCLKKIHQLDNIDLIMSFGRSSLGAVIFSRINKIPFLLNISGVNTPYIHSVTKRSGLRCDKKINQKKKRVPFKLLLIKLQSISVKVKSYLRILSNNLSVKYANTVIVPTRFTLLDMMKRKLTINEDKFIVINEGVKNKISDYDQIKQIDRMNLNHNKKILAFARIEEKSMQLELINKLSSNYNILFIDPVDILICQGDKLTKTSYQIKDVFSVTDVLICAPSFEPHSSTVLEALALDIPVLVTNTGWLEYEFNEFPELLIEYSEVDLIVKKIIEFFDNSDKYIKISAIAKEKLLSKYDFKQCINSYQEILINYNVVIQ
jgi:glycosyltransferase involved in cell wall biosynthesis